MGKENIWIKRFFYKISQAPNLYLTLRLLPIEFNSNKYSFVRFVFVEISGLFSWPQGPQNDPEITQKWPQEEKICKKFPISHVLMQFLSIFR